LKQESNSFHKDRQDLLNRYFLTSKKLGKINSEEALKPLHLIL